MEEDNLTECHVREDIEGDSSNRLFCCADAAFLFQSVRNSTSRVLAGSKQIGIAGEKLVLQNSKERGVKNETFSPSTGVDQIRKECIIEEKTNISPLTTVFLHSSFSFKQHGVHFDATQLVGTFLIHSNHE